MCLSVLLLILLISTPCFGQTLEVRRGLKGCEKIRSEIRATHDTIAFIEKTYREKDPAYADFSIQQQQHLLQRLSEEWSRSKCREVPSPAEKKVLSPFRPKDSMNESPDQVWEVGDRRWTIKEERQFEKWVEENITEDFFIRYRIPTDCADAVYAIRWIYARINHLPAAATTKEGKLIGHWSTEWKHLPTHPEWDQDERFRAALLYLLPKTWTGTLPLDTYPVRISPDSITPGTLFLMTESHTGVIGKVFLDGSCAHPLQTWESALPVKVQKLSSKYFFMGTPQIKNGSGLVKFRWPVSENGEWKYLSAKEHPFYSEEQYASGFCKGYADFVEAVARRIDPVNYAPMEKLVKVMGTTTRLLKERVPIVLEGHQECLNGGCPEGSEWWELHTTAGRDETIVLLMDHLSQIIESNHLNRETVKRMMEAIPIEISKNRSITFYQIFQSYLWLSPDPEDSIEARWGLKKCEMIHVRTHATKNSIAFIEKTYRRRDPKYADFSVRQQQILLRRLNEEWATAECAEPLLAHEKRTRVPSLTKDSTWARRRPKNCQIIRAEMRATNDSIAFIEKTYREKDPRYADLSVRQQQMLLLRLNEEWTTAGCAQPLLAQEKKERVLPPTKERVSTPMKDPAKAHGLSKECEMILAEIRATNDSIAFIEKTYSKKNPEYADFTIQQQQHLLQRLNTEWTESECKESHQSAEK
jgi:hypothetical protein